MTKKQRAALICRVSTPQQIKLGLESQVALLKRRAIKDGYEVPDELIFQEQISGLDAKKPIRKSLQDLMDAVENHKVDVCYTFELTRISRDPYNLIDRVRWFTDRHIPMYIYDADMWTLDRVTKEELEETTSYVFGAATYGKVEAKKMKMRTMRARNEVAKEGLYVGHLADGYCVVQTERGKEIKVDEDRIKVIKRIFDLYTQGYTIDRIAEILNTDNVPTANSYRLTSPKFKGYQETYHRKGSDVPIKRADVRWQGSTISNYLRNKWYIGERTYNKQPYKIDPIVKTEQWNVASAMLEENAITFRSKRESSSHIYLLGGLMFCGKCGKRMYGHYTGLNNHYYCSSIEEGIKCGSRGICKENIEACIYECCTSNAFNSVFRGEDDVFSDFFRLGTDDEKRIKSDIKNSKSIIADHEKLIEEKERKIDNLVDLQAETKHKDLIERYNNSINKCYDEIKRIKEKVTKEYAAIRRNESILRSSKNAKNIIKNIKENKDLTNIKLFFQKVIDKIILYNTESRNNIVRIFFKTGKVTEFIYAAQAMPGKYFPLYEPLFYNDETNRIEAKEYPVFISDGIPFTQSYIDEYKRGNSASKNYSRFLEDAKNDKKTLIIDERSEFTVMDYILHLKSLPTYTGIPSFTRLEDIDELGKQQREHYKLWRKKYNTGRPKQEQYVLHNESYDEICLKRKHLYNRRYKIKNNKSLSEDEKKKKLEEIKYQLDLLSAQVPFIEGYEGKRKKNKKK